MIITKLRNIPDLDKFPVGPELHPGHRIRLSKNEYDEYLKSNHWRSLRASIYVRDPICLICENRNTENVHHLRYKNIYNVNTDDLIGVCRYCHSKVHNSISMTENLNVDQIKDRIYSPRVKITKEIIDDAKSSSVDIQRRVKGLLKCVSLDNCIGKSIGHKTFERIIWYLNSNWFREDIKPPQKRAWTKPTRGQFIHY